MKKIVSIILLLIFITGCSSKETVENNDSDENESEVIEENTNVSSETQTTNVSDSTENGSSQNSNQPIINITIIESDDSDSNEDKENEEETVEYVEINTSDDVIIQTPTELDEPVTYNILTGLNVKKSASAYADYASPESVSDISGIQIMDNVVQIAGGSTVTVYEISPVGENTWGRIGDDAWICLSNGSTNYAIAE